MRRYLDVWLCLFVVLAALASVIAAHGSRVFFGYLVDWWLAWVFTAVLALGIVGLDAAATLEAAWWKRWMYLGGMLLFLAMETLGNYFAGQAVFVARVRAALAASPESDLLRIAAGDGLLTRGLVVLFLALASVAVAFFTFAAATRAKHLAAAQHKTDDAQLRATIQDIKTQLAQATTDHVSVLRERDAVIAQLEADAAQQTERHASAMREQEQATADLRSFLAQQAADLAQARAELEVAKRQAAQQAEDYAAGLRRQEQDIARLREAAAQPPDPQAIDLLKIARRLRMADVPLRETADLVGLPESTLRNRLKYTNGTHPIEA